MGQIAAGQKGKVMATKQFDPTNRVEFTQDAEAPAFGSVIPQISCEEAAQFANRLLHSPDTSLLGEVVLLSEHLREVTMDHVASCPIHRSDELKTLVSSFIRNA